MITRTTTELLEGLHDAANALAWDLFDRRYRPIVVSFAKRLGLQDADAEDVAQETLREFLRSYREGNYDRSRGCRLRDWLKGIAANRVRDFRRRLAKSREHQVGADNGQTGFLQRVPDDGRPDAWEQEWNTHVLSMFLRSARSEFDTSTMKAFELYAIREQSADDVAKELGMSRNAVYIAKSRVIDRLRDLFADFDGR